MRYFSNFNLKLRYCGVLRICGMRYFWRFGQRYLITKKLFYTISDPFLVWLISDRLRNSGNKLKDLEQLDTVTRDRKDSYCLWKLPVSLWLHYSTICLFNSHLKVAVPIGDRCTDTWYRPLLTCVQTTRFAAQSHFSYGRGTTGGDRLCGFILWKRARGGKLSKEKQV